MNSESSSGEDLILREQREELRLFEESLVISPNTVDLSRDPRTVYINRSQAWPSHVAELFIENSKITRCDAYNAALDNSTVAHTRKCCRDWAYRLVDGDGESKLHEPCAGAPILIEQVAGESRDFIFTLLRDQQAVDLLYALDLFLIERNATYRLAAGSAWAWLDKRLSEEKWSRLLSAVRGVSNELTLNITELLAVAVAPWRYMAFQGPRGYRRALVDLGRLISRFYDLAKGSGLVMTSTVDFLDREIDELLELDGVERSIHALCLLKADSERDTKCGR
jgi:hypothetical protein